MQEIARKIGRYGQGILGLRREDVLLTSFPKSGNTWVRFFFGNLIHITEGSEETIDFPTLDRTMPELGVSNLLRPWPHSAVPRIVKTHLRFLPIFHGRRSILVVRDPRDVMVSYYHYEIGRKNPRFTGSFQAFIRHAGFGLEGWFRHYRAWKNHFTVLVKYEDLLRDDVSEFGRMLDALNIPAASDKVRQATAKSRFETLHKLEIRHGLSNPSAFRDGFSFVRKGKSGKWAELFTEKDGAYFQELCRRNRFTLYPRVFLT